MEVKSDAKPLRKLKDAMSVEHLLGHKVKAYIGQCYGVAKSESQAKAIAEDAVVDQLLNGEGVRIEVSQGYLIISQIESSNSAWYTIKRIADLKDGFIYSSCCMSAKGLRAAIESHLKQYQADDELTVAGKE